MPKKFCLKSQFQAQMIRAFIETSKFYLIPTTIREWSTHQQARRVIFGPHYPSLAGNKCVFGREKHLFGCCYVVSVLNLHLKAPLFYQLPNMKASHWNWTGTYQICSFLIGYDRKLKIDSAEFLIFFIYQMIV